MRIRIALALVLCCAYALPAVAATVAVMSCVALDGDTIRCGRVSLRLTGYDAFESCEAGGPEATAALQRILDGGVILAFVGRDRYGRVLARADAPEGPVAALMQPWQRDRHVPRPACQTAR